MTLSLTVLGADGSFPAPGGACSGYLLRTDTTALWIDAGSGTYANLKTYIDIGDISAVFLSHEHADHCVNVLDFGVEMLVSRTEISPVSVLSPAGVGHVLRPLMENIRHLAMDVVADGDTRTVGDLFLTFSRTAHPPETLAVRVDHEGRSLVYSADTGPEWDITALGPDIDVALLEAGALESQPGRHMTAAEAGAMAKRAGAKRLILTHVRPDHDRENAAEQGAATFGGPVELTTTGAQFDL